VVGLQCRNPIFHPRLLRTVHRACHASNVSAAAVCSFYSTVLPTQDDDNSRGACALAHLQNGRSASGPTRASAGAYFSLRHAHGRPRSVAAHESSVIRTTLHPLITPRHGRLQITALGVIDSTGPYQAQENFARDNAANWAS